VAKNDYSCSASQRANLLSNAQATVVLAESSKIASFPGRLSSSDIPRHLLS